MPTAFSRSLRALHADQFRRSLWALLLVTLVLATGAAWFCFARVEVYETSHDARLEVDREVHPLTALAPGRVVKTTLSVGRSVEAGELLVQLDAEGEQLRADEERARLSSLPKRLDALRNEIAAADQSWIEERKTALLASEEARGHQREAEAAALFAEGEAKRLARLDESGLVSKAEKLKAESEASQKRAAAAALGSTVGKLEAEVVNREKNHQARLARLKSEQATLEGDVTTCEASLKRCEYEIERRRLRAPIAGRLGDVSNVRPGAFVAEGTRLAAILPDGELKVVAHFPPLSAAGRILPGQRARLRLDGFPWIQFGSLAGQVTSVASEPREGLIRVELQVDPKSAPRIPVQHGLPGAAEITVERVTPAALVFRAVGKVIASPSRR